MPIFACKGKQCILLGRTSLLHMQTLVIIEANRGYVLLWFLLYKEQKPCTLIQGFRGTMLGTV